MTDIGNGFGAFEQYEQKPFEEPGQEGVGENPSSELTRVPEEVQSEGIIVTNLSGEKAELAQSVQHMAKSVFDDAEVKSEKDSNLVDRLSPPSPQSSGSLKGLSPFNTAEGEMTLDPNADLDADIEDIQDSAQARLGEIKAFSEAFHRASENNELSEMMEAQQGLSKAVGALNKTIKIIARDHPSEAAALSDQLNQVMDQGREAVHGQKVVVGKGGADLALDVSPMAEARAQLDSGETPAPRTQEQVVVDIACGDAGVSRAIASGGGAVSATKEVLTDLAGFGKEVEGHKDESLVLGNIVDHCFDMLEQGVSVSGDPNRSQGLREAMGEIAERAQVRGEALENKELQFQGQMLANLINLHVPEAQPQEAGNVALQLKATAQAALDDPSPKNLQAAQSSYDALVNLGKVDDAAQAGVDEAKELFFQLAETLDYHVADKSVEQLYVDLSSMMHEEILNIDVSEFDYGDLTDASKTPTFHQATRSHTQAGELFAVQMLQSQTPKEGGAIFAKGVKVAQMAFERGDYNLGMAIIASLNRTEILRLEKDIDAAGSRVGEAFDDLSENIEQGYPTLRKRMDSDIEEGKGFVPFLPMFAGDSVFTKEGNPSMDGDNVLFGRMTNVGKLKDKFKACQEGTARADTPVMSKKRSKFSRRKSKPLTQDPTAGIALRASRHGISDSDMRQMCMAKSKT